MTHEESTEYVLTMIDVIIKSNTLRQRQHELLHVKEKVVKQQPSDRDKGIYIKQISSNMYRYHCHHRHQTDKKGTKCSIRSPAL